MVKKSINECVRNFRGLLCICIIITVCSIFQNEVYAEAGNKVISTDGQWISDSVEDNVNYYYFSIPEAGLVTFYFQTFSSKGECTLCSGDLYKEYGSVALSGSLTNPSTGNNKFYLEAGSYCLKILSQYGSEWTGSYRLKVEYDLAGNNEVEPNNEFETAMLISENNEVKGLISCDDELDFYKMNIDNEKIVEILISHNLPVFISIWSSDYVPIVKHDYCGYEVCPHRIVRKLSPGTYYIKIDNESHTGTYTLKYISKINVSDIKLKKSTISLTKGQTYSLLKTILPNNATNKKLEWSSTNESVATVDEKGKVKAVGTGITTITAESQDDGDVEANCVVVVKPSKEKISSVSEGYSSWYHYYYISVNANFQSGVNGYQYQWSTKSNMSKAKSDTYYSASCTVKPLKKNTKYYVRVRGYVEYDGKKYYGPWSSVRSVKTRKFK